MNTSLMMDPVIAQKPSELILLYNTVTGSIELSSRTNLFSDFTGKDESEMIQIFHTWLNHDGIEKFYNNWAICKQLETGHQFSWHWDWISG